MQSIRLSVLIPAVLFALGLSSHLQAEVVTVEVTIKSVDAKGRTITAIRKGKTLELDVSRKAPVTINGKAGTLDSLKAGQKVELSYHTDLEVVTKIEAKIEDDSPSSPFDRVSLTISANGKCKLGLGKSAKDQKGTDGRKSIKLKAFSGADVFKLDDGRLEIVHDFKTFTEIKELMAAHLPAEAAKQFTEQISIDKDAGFLVLTPSDNKRAMWPYPRMLTLPINVVLDVGSFEEGVLQLQFNIGQSVLVVTLHGNKSPTEDVGTAKVSWLPTRNGKFQSLLKFSQEDEDAVEKDFDLPKGDWSDQGRGFVSVGLSGEIPIAVQRLSVTAKITPSFGAQLSQRGKRVLIKRVIGNGAAAKAGIKQGDVVVKIGDSSVTDVKQAMKLLQEGSLGEPSNWTVQRFGKTRRIGITPR